jgi:hypothetical protein
VAQVAVCSQINTKQAQTVLFKDPVLHRTGEDCLKRSFMICTPHKTLFVNQINNNNNNNNNKMDGNGETMGKGEI